MFSLSNALTNVGDDVMGKLKHSQVNSIIQTVDACKLVLSQQQDLKSGQTPTVNVCDVVFLQKEKEALKDRMLVQPQQPFDSTGAYLYVNMLKFSTLVKSIQGLKSTSPEHQTLESGTLGQCGETAARQILQSY